jgi:hypothetical protein
MSLYMYVRGGRIYVCYGCKLCPCICVLEVVVYMCARGVNYVPVYVC